MFCQVNVWADPEYDLARWLADFEDDADFIRNALYINLICPEGRGREAAASFCAKYPDNAFCFAVPEQNRARGYAAAVKHEACYANYTTTAVALKASALGEMEGRTGARQDIKLWSFYPVFLQPDGTQKAYFPWPAGNFHHSNSRFDRFSLFLPGYLIPSGLPLGEGFGEDGPEDWDVLFLLRAVFDGKDYMLTDIPLLSREPFDNDFYNYRRQFDPDWYTRTLLEVYLPFLKKHPKSPFVKAMVMYQVAARFACNRNDRCKELLYGEELTRFFQAVSEVLNRIDDSIIVAYNRGGWKHLPKHMGLVFLRIKYRNPALMPTIAVDGAGGYTAVYKTALLDTKSTLKAAITCMDHDRKNGELVIDGKLTNAYVFRYDKIRCWAMTGKGRLPVRQTQVYTLDKYFGCAVHRDYTFQLRLGAEVLESTQALSFRFQYGDLTVTLPLTFPRMESRLTERFPHSYWRFGKWTVTLDPGKTRLRLGKWGGYSVFKREMLLWRDFLRTGQKTERSRGLKSILLRMAYWLTKPFAGRKEIWLTFDQLFKGGDNGEYFFRYVCDCQPGRVKMYYVANSDCRDYQRLKAGYPNVLAFHSLRARLTALHASCVFATRVDVKQYCGFGPQLEAYFRDLLGYEVFCLQHGLTIQRIAQYQNRLFDNTKLYFCVSPNEVENLRHPVYDYDPKTLVLTGAARYDGLKNDDRKQILITPTWRRNVTAGTNRKGSQHGYSVNFKQSEYYRIYNSLIHNKRLLKCAEETGYRIVYLLHPIVSPQAWDFQVPEQVELLKGADGDVSYETLLRQSSLMVTDHSGIQFDFAFMGKPLVYYHPETLPPQYAPGGIDYETQGFGPVCRGEAEVVDALCRAMQNQCKLEPIYRERRDRFFAYTDRENCSRIFQAAAQYRGLNVDTEISQGEV